MHTIIIRILIFSFYGLGLSGCDSFEKPVSPFSRTHELVVITVEYADNFYVDDEGNFSGITYDLVHEFAAEIGLEIRFVVKSQVESALAALQKHQAHFAIGLDIPEEQASRFVLGPVYLHTHHQIAFNAKNNEPNNIQRLIGKKIEVPIGSTHEKQLQKIKSEIPELTWSAVALSSEALLAKLDRGDIAYTVADSLHIKKANHFYPRVKGAFELDASVSRWIFPKFTEKLLLDKANAFFERIMQEGVLGQLLDSYNGQYHQLSPGDIYFFKKKIQSKLPGLKSYFLQAQRITDIDWRLLAALAYQESHWNPQAKSPTGVRGMMMLTRETARRMKVKNPAESRQNIVAGARYLKMLKDKLPESVLEPDRTWIALAAYNQGYGRIIDARALAKRFNLNPDLWIDLKKTLPLLNKEHYSNAIKYGHARGDEAVTLTNSVRAYYEILKNVAAEAS
ncbi:MAG TPA: membrane-bound lytic murein transglycosylase MltF [Nitrosomonas sp.]|uniref:membrane-bound lytic murein transglycosylase MltF n=1 Tax=Nitrosomonas sp. TaxID=42353 RepID=UPI000E9CF6DD|nr:membrane-bound lytic murein transglycosylase MltF [Nitrosomonas sp.]GJL75845.1 MAG: membrane-bound lytic murein transglycosylase F [Nitrosomonas sp.]HBV20850.1 membrane-bound lytic murein transglycosylase MltF [Nitrosomonas sp.]